MRKTVLITGASGGIGGAAAREFAKAGYSVAIHYFHNESAAEKLKEEILASGGDALTFPADLCNPEEVKNLFSDIRRPMGDVTHLINNAGISHMGLLTHMSLDCWNSIMETNLTSAFLCAKEALPSMIREKAGCIVNVSSMWGQTGASCEVAYSTSKAALIGFTKALAKEVGPSGIRVNCVAPGLIDTPMNSRLTPEDILSIKEETPLMKIGSPEDVAKAMLFLCENDFITGEVLSVNGGLVI